MRKVNALALVALFAGTVGAQTNAPLVVTNAANEGEGSLRAALEAASFQSGSKQIVIKGDQDIVIDETLRYRGTAPLEIIGNGQTVRSAENVHLLVSANGGNLSVSHLNFEGPGGFSVLNRGDLNGEAGGKGIFIDVRDDQTGVVELELDHVAIKGVANYGVHVSDCNLADDCGAGAGGGGQGSPASISVRLNNVTIEDVGNGTFDGDGLRVDDRDVGDIVLHAINSTFTRAGADGLELDEGDAGDVYATFVDSAFTDNGAYCDPVILNAYLPDEPEGEFADGERAEADIPGAVTGTPDDSCFEREVSLYDSGSVEDYEIGIDIDDGVDFDEDDNGSLNLTLVRSVISGNYDEGVDMDEAGLGDANLTYIDTRSYANADDGFKMSEEGGGHIVAMVDGSVARDNGGKGFVFEEEQGGDVRVHALNVHTVNNDDSDDTGFEVVQEDGGQGELIVEASQIDDGIEAEGVSVQQ
jgi:hypothetical protein